MTEPSHQNNFLSQISTVEETPLKEEDYSTKKELSLPKLVARVQLDKSRLSSPPLSTVRRKKPKKLPQWNEKSLIVDKMK